MSRTICYCMQKWHKLQVQNSFFIYFLRIFLILPLHYAVFHLKISKNLSIYTNKARKCKKEENMSPLFHIYFSVFSAFFVVFFVVFPVFFVVFSAFFVVFSVFFAVFLTVFSAAGSSFFSVGISSNTKAVRAGR